MLFRITILCLFTFSTIGLFAQNKFSYGIELGNGYSKLGLNTSSELYKSKENNWKGMDITFSGKQTLSLALNVEYQLLNKLRLGIGAGYHSWGGKVKTVNYNPQFLYSASDLDIYYQSLEFPLYLKIIFLQKNRFNFYVSGGYGLMHTFRDHFYLLDGYLPGEFNSKVNFDTYFIRLALGTEIKLKHQSYFTIGFSYSTDTYNNHSRIHDFEDFWGLGKIPLNYKAINFNLGVKFH